MFFVIKKTGIYAQILNETSFDFFKFLFLIFYILGLDVL